MFKNIWSKVEKEADKFIVNGGTFEDLDLEIALKPSDKTYLEGKHIQLNITY